MVAGAAINGGFLLIDCVIYIAVLAVILGLAFAAFFRTLEHSTELGRTAQATVQALQTGEQWRADIRIARLVSLVNPNTESGQLRLSGPQGDIEYDFRDGNIVRRANPTAPWIEVLKEVKVSRFSQDRRRAVNAWRWDVELAPRQETSKFRRVLTFEAVPMTKLAPAP